MEKWDQTESPVVPDKRQTSEIPGWRHVSGRWEQLLMTSFLLMQRSSYLTPMERTKKRVEDSIVTMSVAAAILVLMSLFPTNIYYFVKVSSAAVKSKLNLEIDLGVVFTDHFIRG